MTDTNGKTPANLENESFPPTTLLPERQYLRKSTLSVLTNESTSVDEMNRAASPARSIAPLLSASTPPPLLPSTSESTITPLNTRGVRWKGIDRRFGPSSRRYVRLVQRVLCHSGIVLVFILLFYLLTLLLASQANPNQYNYSAITFPWHVDPRTYLQPWNTSFGAYNVLLDGHIHTTRSDGMLTPEQIVDWAVAHGYNALAVTDHNTVQGGLDAKAYAEKRYPGTLTVIVGQEYSCCRIHMNILGVNETIMPKSPWPTDADLKSAIEQAHKLGGIVIVNHMWWSNRTTAPYQLATLPNQPSLATLDAMGIDGVEIVNGNTEDRLVKTYANQHPTQGNRTRPLIQITGSDMHYPDGAYAWTALKVAEPITQQSILQALKTTPTTVLMDAGGTRNRSYPVISQTWYAYSVFSLFTDFFSSFITEYRGMYSFMGTFCQPRIIQVQWMMIFWLVVWVIIGVAVVEFLLWSTPLLSKWLLRKGHDIWQKWRRKRPRQASVHALEVVV